MPLYEPIWEQFLAAGELADHWRDWSAWAGPRTTHLLFLAHAGGDGRVAARVARVQAALERVDGLALHPRRSLHLTVQALGFLAQDRAGAGEQVDERDLPQIVERARQVLAGQLPFTVHVGGANSFYSSAFLEVFDGGALGQLRSRLQAALPGPGAAQSLPEFVFHLTVAYYRGGDSGAVRRALEGLRALSPLAFRVRQVELVAVQTDGIRPFPSMARLAGFALTG